MAIAVHHHHLRRLLLEKQATTSSTNLSPSEANPRITHGSYNTNNNQANFDTNMVIILAALLCALICALGLNSILRCAMRCSRRFASDNPDANAATAAAARLAATGIKKRALNQIPVAAFGPELNIKATDCLICLGEFVDGEKIRVLPRCNHGFHVRCIDTWLLSHSSCPTCRQSLLEQPPAPENGSNDAEVAVAVVGARQDGNIPAAAAVDEDICWSRRIRTLPPEYHQPYGLPTEWNLNYFILLFIYVNLFFNFSYFSTEF